MPSNRATKQSKSDRRSCVDDRVAFRLAALLATLLCVGFALATARPVRAGDAGDHQPGTSPEADRRAILAMAGEYRVDFRFEETLGLVDGYELDEPYTAGATEYVEVIEDTGDRIVLQHVLVMHPKKDDAATEKADGDEPKPFVVKHWRQDWVFQDQVMTEFAGGRTFVTRHLDASEVRGTWSQAVYQVDDSPRYEALGRWTHDSGRSAWESDETWRPLPRREAKTRNRDDYHVLLAVNRHVLLPDGWAHEQDNQKLVLDDDGNPAQVIAHESGLNVYRRIDDVDFSAGREYWADTSIYWREVRQRWDEVLQPEGTYHIAAKLDDKPLYTHIFGIAKEVREAGEYRAEHREKMHALIAKSMVQTDDASAASDPADMPNAPLATSR